MAVELTTPITTPAQASQTFDKLYLEFLTVRSPCGSNKCIVQASLRPYSDTGLGQPVPVFIRNLFEDMTEDEAAVMYQVVELLKRRASL